jgi:hypothetical protein
MKIESSVKSGARKATYSNGRGKRSRPWAIPFIGDLDTMSLPGPRPRDYGRDQATAALGALRMTR